MEPAISIKNISKRYKIFHREKGYVALRDVISNILSKPFSFAKGKAKKILGRATKEEFWALKDINLEINKGEVVGVIGKNGAGKSTLLKILTGITPPTEGEITIRGKVASLLEVGTGFHPELTGRENIFLNGAILGMTRKEIAKNYDRIVEFSGIEKFIDTPVKRYSSGMYVRLAFSVAAHLEPDILLVDEVLAVGDAEFQKKCLGKMDEVTKQAGRTIVFVSHNMGAVQKLCPKSILLEDGKIKKIGPTKEVIETYLSDQRDTSGELSKILPFKAKKDLVMSSFIVEQDSVDSVYIDNDRPFRIKIQFEATADIPGFRTGVYIKNQINEVIIRTFTSDWNLASDDIKAGKYEAVLEFPARVLPAGNYSLELHASSYGRITYLPLIERQITVSKPSEFNINHPNEPLDVKVLLDKPWTLKRT